MPLRFLKLSITEVSILTQWTYLRLLFREANEEEYAKIKEKWKILTKILEDCHEKPLRFLRYYILSHQNLDKVLKEDEVYDWFCGKFGSMWY